MTITTGNPHPDLEEALKKKLLAWREWGLSFAGLFPHGPQVRRDDPPWRGKKQTP